MRVLLTNPIARFIGWMTVMAACAVGIGAADTDPKPARQRIIILGDSITAGYGVDAAEAYPSLLQQKIDTDKLPK